MGAPDFTGHPGPLKMYTCLGLGGTVYTLHTSDALGPVVVWFRVGRPLPTPGVLNTMLSCGKSRESEGILSSSR